MKLSPLGNLGVEIPLWYLYFTLPGIKYDYLPHWYLNRNRKSRTILWRQLQISMHVRVRISTIYRSSDHLWIKWKCFRHANCCNRDHPALKTARITKDTEYDLELWCKDCVISIFGYADYILVYLCRRLVAQTKGHGWLHMATENSQCNSGGK